MPREKPHFLLFVETSAPAGTAAIPRWRFALEAVGPGGRLVAEDAEPDADEGRLEAPSRVTLVTRSNYVARGIRRGLTQWRERDWRWERFGRRVPVRDHDLWQRVDRALRFHKVECRVWRFDEPVRDEPLAGPHFAIHPEQVPNTVSAPDEPAVVIVPRTRPRRTAVATNQRPAIARLPERLASALTHAIQTLVDPGYARA